MLRRLSLGRRGSVAIALTMAVALSASNRVCAAPVAEIAGTIFNIHTDEFWLNLHHFLYVLGRADAAMRDASREPVRDAPTEAARGVATLTDAERQTWTDVVHTYALGISHKDVVFDAPPGTTRSGP